jgi:hypothetical protein
MAASWTPSPKVGRILTSEERAERMADEAARSIPNEIRRSGFAISDRHVLTAWHCVRDPMTAHVPLWFRLRDEAAENRRYSYVPIRVTNYDERLDVAALAVDTARLGESGLTATEATVLLASATIPLSTDVNVHDWTQVMGFPESASGADSDTNSGEVVETALPLGDAIGLKLFCPALAAVDPVKPRGLSGGPVLLVAPGMAQPSHAAVGLIRAAPIGSAPGTAAGGGLIASRMKDVAARLPEVAVMLPVKDPRSNAEDGAALSHSPNVLAVFAACSKVLRDTVLEFNDPGLGILTGWSHFLHDAVSRRPTAIGTAYGLKLALSIDEPDGRLSRSALAETLWKLRKADGGWAARTQSEIGRPEVTALALGALTSAGHNPDRLLEATARFEKSLSAENDPVGMVNTYVVSAVIRGLVLAKPDSQKLPELRAALLAGAIPDPDRENLLCWSERFFPKRNQVLVPSVAHTAHAVVALARSCQVLGEDARSRLALDQAIRWLMLRPALDNKIEQIRRVITEEHQETLIVRHFTAAWVARAILAASPNNLPETGRLLDKAIQRVWATQRKGIWEWDDHDLPIWMTYQGICVLRDYALASSSCFNSECWIAPGGDESDSTK